MSDEAEAVPAQTIHSRSVPEGRSIQLHQIQSAFTSLVFQRRGLLDQVITGKIPGTRPLDRLRAYALAMQGAGIRGAVREEAPDMRILSELTDEELAQVAGGKNLTVILEERKRGKPSQALVPVESLDVNPEYVTSDTAEQDFEAPDAAPFVDEMDYEAEVRRRYIPRWGITEEDDDEDLL